MKNNPKGKLPVLPEASRERLIDQMVEWVSAWFRARAEEVLEEPGQYGEDLEEVRCQICGAVAEDLENDYGEAIEELIGQAYAQVATTSQEKDEGASS